MSDAPSHPSMLPKFEGEGGKRRLAEVLRRQSLLAGDNRVCEAIANQCQLVEAVPSTSSEVIIQQGNADDDIYFIISGRVTIRVNGRDITTRPAGTHVGEMATTDTTARRSATVIAREPTLLAKVAQAQFSSLAQQYPDLWRGIAVNIAERLRERIGQIRPPHNQPVVFIGSSSERLKVAQEIQLGLAHDPMVVQVWTDGIFKASRTSIENMLAAVDEADFAVLVVSPDDVVESRGVEAYGPRDNVLFELGLFMGGIRRERTYIVKPRAVDLKIPSDLLGVTPLEYAPGPDDTLRVRIAPVCTELRKLILGLGPK